MANKKQSNDLKTSLEKIRHTNWFDGIHKLPNNVDKELLDQCSILIEEFIKNDESLPKMTIKSAAKLLKPQVSKIKKSNIKATKIKQLKSNSTSKKLKISKKTNPSFHYSNITSTTGYPCYPSAFPCFRSCGPINCPENKLPMPRDLWYRIVYSQALEQQLGSGEYVVQNRSVVHSPSSWSKRKHKEDESITDKSSSNNLHRNLSNTNNSFRQQTMNTALSSASTKMVKLDIPSISYKPFPMDNLEYIAETLPLKTENQHCDSQDFIYQKTASIENQINLWNTNHNKTISSTESAHAELINPPKILRGISADAALEQLLPIPSAPSASILLNRQSNFKEITSSSIQFEQSQLSIEPSTNKIAKETSHVDSLVSFEHPLIHQLIENYHLADIPRPQLFKQLNRRLAHIHQTLKFMPSNDIETRLKYKSDALLKKRQTPNQSLTNDERIAMAELELNVYEYSKALDEPSSKCFRINNNNNDEFENEKRQSIYPLLLSCDTILPVVKNTVISETSMSTFTIAFEPMTPLSKAQIQKQLARRHEHICKKAKELDRIQLQAQIDSKSKEKESESIVRPRRSVSYEQRITLKVPENIKNS
ncbi:unnamed protein product [Rotaria magnacalcarata]|uniref:Uncharacterized protein n=2 Tax=Rotaria magnacalcarata TaxID=392030 RepID=A0A819BTA1_9BILA|nr:unnamed protein product [Rotaria magnacalcarata]